VKPVWWCSTIIEDEPNLIAAACQMQNCDLGVPCGGNGGRWHLPKCWSALPAIRQAAFLLTLGAGGVLTEILGDTVKPALARKPH
jgi:hypothetical protein